MGASYRLVIAWLRGDPESIRGVRERLPLLEGQGILVLFPAPGEPVDADVAVLPPPGSIEDHVYDYSVVRAGRLVRVEGFRRALFESIAGVRGRFSYVAAGVDPGRECGVSLLGDGVLLDATRLDCQGVGGYIKGLLDDVPHDWYTVFVGDGPGFGDAVESLEAEGLRYVVLEESYTTRGVLPVYPWVRDKDILASIRIAYKGVYGGDRQFG